MSLTWRQRRALHAIEQTLAEQDPRLAELLSGLPTTQRATLADWVGWTMFCMAVVLLAAGLALVDPSLLQGGLELLALLPPLVLLVAAASRAKP
jgi:hypothetical protein